MTVICLIPGDGVGQEVVPVAALVLAQVLAEARPAVHFTHAEAGWGCFLRRGVALPDETFAAIRAADATLFGATQSPSTQVLGYRSPILEMRKRLDLFANLRPARSLAGAAREVDLLIVRENTEGLYSGRERREGETAIAERVITGFASRRIAHMAFRQARLRADGANSRRPRVTVVHKANVLKISDGLFRECCLEVASEYPEVEVSEMLVDAAAMWLASDPGRFDVLVTTNLFGDILSDIAAGVTGGLGMAPSANVGSGVPGVFEPVHGSAPDIAGRGIANPCGAILSGALLLDNLGYSDAAGAVRRAVDATLAAGIMTPDLGGHGTTTSVGAAVRDRLEPAVFPLKLEDNP